MASSLIIFSKNKVFKYLIYFSCKVSKQLLNLTITWNMVERNLSIFDTIHILYFLRWIFGYLQYYLVNKERHSKKWYEITSMRVKETMVQRGLWKMYLPLKSTSWLSLSCVKSWEFKKLWKSSRLENKVALNKTWHGNCELFPYLT